MPQTPRPSHSAILLKSVIVSLIISAIFLTGLISGYQLAITKFSSEIKTIPNINTCLKDY